MKPRVMCRQCSHWRTSANPTGICISCWLNIDRPEPEEDDCPHCGGSGGGADPALYCPVCRGTGRGRREREYDLD